MVSINGSIGGSIPPGTPAAARVDAWRPRTYLGIDPGVNGGLVALEEHWIFGQRGRVRKFSSMPDTEAGRYEWIKDQITWASRFGGGVVGVIESVGGYRKGSAGNVGSSMFNFGWNYGGLRMAMIAEGMREAARQFACPALSMGGRFVPVAAVSWQMGLGITPKVHNESKTMWKNRLRDFAASIFPELSVTLDVADALLLAEYCRRMVEGGLIMPKSATKGGKGSKRCNKD